MGTKRDAVEKREKFLKYGKSRTNNVVTAMERVRKLANHRRYDWTKEEVGKMVKRMETEIEKIKLAFDINEDGEFEF